jgi:hypothetical protein
MIDASAPDLIAINGNRIDGKFTADVGVYKNASIPTGKLGLGLGLSASATKTVNGKNVISLLSSQYVKPFVPQSIARRVKDYEAKSNVSVPTKKRETLTFGNRVGFTNNLASQWADYMRQEEIRKNIAEDAALRKLWQKLGAHRPLFSK